ncbi:thiamine pyrophosphate-binding protein [Permianibacter fluminis]|uniref:thiamine pyrophosphate-binding protein n=1 Tax=Permianibacter fluminis TaxID=2738515 RepID=UPI001B7D7F20|nr:thiamine pyrophosphate-binding protein [Permianibacter fluminis]
MPACRYEDNFGEAYQQQLPALGEAMVAILRHFGADCVYGVGGDFAANLIAAFDSKLDVLPSSNEMHAAFCACAGAEITGIGVCLTTYTVGSLPCMSAAALAKTESLPVIFLSGAPGEAEVHRNAIHHTVHPSGAWCADYDAALRAFAGLGIRAERLQGARHPGQPNVAAYHFYELVRHAWLKREPVFIEVPRDLVFTKTQALALPANCNEQLNSPMLFSGAPVIATTIAEKLQQAQAPLIYVGEQVKLNSALRQQIQTLCQRHHIPYATSWFAKGLFDDYDPLCLGGYNGIFTAAERRRYIESAVDYVLDIGTSIFTQDTGHAFQTGTHRIEQIENRTVVKSTLAREQDLLTLIEQVLYLLPATYNAPALQSTASSQSTAPVELAEQAPLEFNNLAAVLNSLQASDERAYIYVPEVGNSFFASCGLQTRASQLGRSWLTNPWYAAMGTSLPYARVASERVQAMQASDRVVLLTGDGGFHFQLNELIHFQKQQLPLIIVYMRNNIFELGKSGDGPIYHCSDAEFDVQMLVRAYGGTAYSCATVGEFRRHFQQAVNRYHGITLLEVPCRSGSEFQSPEIRLLNLFIRSRNGDADAIKQWAMLGSPQHAQ